ncbi:F-box protein CPR1-like [Silene latifolia]|uniref:F-box protein CPR1-like n=1 Tax=Silene latifolia TaxID=37657 RepID=UPI003D77822C
MENIEATAAENPKKKLNFGMEMEDNQGGLPDDIIGKILSYVPPKPLTRFKVVSKSFLNLINDTTFQLLHIKHNSSTISNYISLAALISPHEEEEEDEEAAAGYALLTLQLPASSASSGISISKCRIPLPFPSSSATPFDIIASCNGLLCISSFADSLHLINPTSSSFHPIPLLPSPPHHPRWIHFGFGFDQINRDYKIVRVVQLHHFSQDHPREVHVFSFLTNSWIQATHFPHFLSHPISNAKLLRNSLHWIATTTHPLVFDMTGLLWRGSLDDFVYDYVLLAFDLHFHTFTVLPLPDYHLGDAAQELAVPRLCVGVFGESLFLQVEHGPKFGRCVDIWVMSEYGVKSSWTKLLSFPYMEVRPELLPIKTLALSKQGHQVLMQQGKDCFWVQVGSGQVTDVIIEGGLPFVFTLIGGHRCGFGAEVFVESLVCLTSGVEGKGIKQAGDADGKDGGSEAGQVKTKVKVQKKRGGDLLSSRFKLI